MNITIIVRGLNSYMIKCCCFTGHRPKALPWGEDESGVRCSALKSKIKFAAEGLIVENGCEKFITGMARGADIICAEVILALKILYPKVKLECAVPNHAFASAWCEKDLLRYSSVLTRADIINFMSDKNIYSKRDLMIRNIYMVDNSEAVIAVYTAGESGGTHNTLKYAERKNKNIIIIEP